MSSTTWTPDALRSEARPFTGTVWRLVEAQHKVSTLKLVDTLSKQTVLEQLLDDSKPSMPHECRDLDYLLATPFRYRPVQPTGSRFRCRDHPGGVFYAALALETAVAEIAFHRLLFFSEAPGTPLPENPLELTAFSVQIATERAISLRRPPFSDMAPLWTSHTDYSACQRLSEDCRHGDADVELIEYQSVRDPAQGSNVAVLTCRAFAERKPGHRRTWRLRLSAGAVQAIQEFPELRLEFPAGTFAADPRITIR